MKVKCNFEPRGAYADQELLSKYLQGGVQFGVDLGDALQKRRNRLNGFTINLNEDEEMVIIGGRNSIRQAFGNLPVAEYRIQVPAGRMLYCSDHRTSGNKGLAAVGGGLGVAQMLSGPLWNAAAAGGQSIANPSQSNFVRGYANSMRNTYRPSEVNFRFSGLNAMSKKLTVLRIFSDVTGFQGTNLGPSQTGAGIAIALASQWHI